MIHRSYLETSRPFWWFNRKTYRHCALNWNCTPKSRLVLTLITDFRAFWSEKGWRESELFASSSFFHQDDILSGTKRLVEWEVFKNTIKTTLTACHPKQLWLPYRNAREKTAVKEPLDKEGLDLAKPLVSKIWNKNKQTAVIRKRWWLLLKDIMFIFRAEKKNTTRETQTPVTTSHLAQLEGLQVNKGVTEKLQSNQTLYRLISLAPVLRDFPGLLQLPGKAHSCLVI